jgi:seryl-tRNA(Sec) selenium transferase
VVSVDASIAGIDANRVITSLQEGNPAIFVFEHSGNQGTVVFLPEALGAGEAEIVARRLREILLQDK